MFLLYCFLDYCSRSTFRTKQRGHHLRARAEVKGTSVLAWRHLVLCKFKIYCFHEFWRECLSIRRGSYHHTRLPAALIRRRKHPREATGLRGGSDIRSLTTTMLTHPNQHGRRSMLRSWTTGSWPKKTRFGSSGITPRGARRRLHPRRWRTSGARARTPQRS